jgi:hypothetical protein
MNAPCRTGAVATALGAVILFASGAPAQVPAGDTTGVEIQTRGPVHEAFARPTAVAAQPAQVIPKEPPQPLREQPPDVKPEGDKVEWVGGYWAWDAERNEFIWISGVWRDSPPGRKYVPGYWEQTDGGWRWVGGYWAPADGAEQPYVPQPPADKDQGPSVPPPSDNYQWTPGYWAYRDTRFVWQPGYYALARVGMVWVPPSYVWTPAGYLCVGGYWDWPLDQRGVLFANVAFGQPVYQTPGWVWRPHYAVGTVALLDSLFVDTRGGYYRYGDYYGRSYFDAGIHPWHGYAATHHDPLYSYYRRTHRNDAGWQAGLAKTYDARLAGTAPRPARTLALQGTVGPKTGSVIPAVVQPVTQVNNVKLNKVTGPQVVKQAAPVVKNVAAVMEHKHEAKVTTPAVKVINNVQPATKVVNNVQPAAKVIAQPPRVTSAPPPPRQVHAAPQRQPAHHNPPKVNTSKGGKAKDHK